MTIKTYLDGYRERHYVLCTDCAGDQGLETAWKQITKVIENGYKDADIQKIANSLTKKPENNSFDHNLRVGLRAAERYCLGKLLSGETENKINTSGRWDPLKNAITEEFFDTFSVSEVYNRIKEYFISIASCHYTAKNDIRTLVFYGPGLLKYPSDMTKKEMLQAGMSDKNRYYRPEYIKAMEFRRRDFENAARKVELKYKVTDKDEERIDKIISSHASREMIIAQAEKIKTADKAVARWALGLKKGHNYKIFLKQARDLGVTNVELEAYALKYTGNGYFTDYMMPNEAEAFEKARKARLANYND